MESFKNILQKFDPVSLDEINEVKLMNRIDRKYWFHLSLLEELLDQVSPFYHVLQIKGQRLMEYHSSYFDTVTNTMYLKHHNRKLNRYKVRQRQYVVSGHSFLEIKFKTNKKRTIKKRIPTNMNGVSFFKNECDFLHENSPFAVPEIIPSLQNRFRRITLIHKEKKDRCTIDISPEFWNEKGKIKLNNLVVFELKRGKSLKGSPMVDILRQMKIRQRGLSKYCTGRALLDKTLKQNAFKPRLRFLNKIN